MLKADLERLVEDQATIIESLERKLAARDDIGVAWVAHSSPGEPVCYTGTCDDKGLSLNIYRDEDGDVTGVTVWDLRDIDDMELLAAVGTVTVTLSLDEQTAAEVL